MSTIVKVERISKFYGNKLALDQISFDLKSSGIHGFLGPNGAGKSTTLKILNRLLDPDMGTVKYQDNLKISFCSDKQSFYQDLLVSEFFELVSKFKNVSLKERPFADLFESLGGSQLNNRLIANLSKGNKQKVAILQAFIGKSDLYILDEPTAYLDPQSIAVFRKFLLKISEQSCVFISSHVLTELQALSESVTILNQGKVLFSGKLIELEKKATDLESSYLSLLELNERTHF
jgi:ABC-2 type transport system ATP-binding protein